ncbi:hypothetical protein Lnau_0443 [Legionella nautarum]|uniref:Uncharacterized protein n=1 Tax=Legionella nautarum TaxID=45070 RepID=A0A0W0X274_9GAMM|nr:hypothetical protein [Legionella nautarum]KTD38633.1 hypothetical protein Lnau_0443 [Legionella nautarum]
MKPFNSYLKINIIGQIILILFLLTFLLNETYAKAGSCAKHGTVVGCNTSTGYQTAMMVHGLPVVNIIKSD